MEKKEMGAKLKEMRINSKLKWNELLSRLESEYGFKIAQSTIYGYENGHGCPDPNVFLALCKLYNCDDVMFEFGYSKAPTLVSDDIEEIVLFEHEYSPENWEMIKNFIALVPTVKSK